MSLSSSFRNLPDSFFRPPLPTTLTTPNKSTTTTTTTSEQSPTTTTDDTKSGSASNSHETTNAATVQPSYESIAPNFTPLLLPTSTTSDSSKKTVTPKRLKRTRRGRYKNKNMYTCDKFCIYHTNIQSVKGRLNSLEAIVNSYDVDLVTINETNLKKNDKLKIEGYTCFSRNRKNAAMGGVSTAVNDRHSMNVLKVSEGENVEYIVIRLGQFQPAINIINVYGAQETRQSLDEIHADWESIMEEVVKIETKEEFLVLLGDLNLHIGKSLVPENHPKTSVGGKLLIDFLENNEYVLLNSQQATVGSPFTRYDKTDPHNSDKKSLLDYVIVSTGLATFVDKCEIDSKLEWTPSRRKNGSLNFPDHYALK